MIGQSTLGKKLLDCPVIGCSRVSVAHKSEPRHGFNMHCARVSSIFCAYCLGFLGLSRRKAA
jgi:hypothetical protein